MMPMRSASISGRFSSQSSTADVNRWKSGRSLAWKYISPCPGPSNVQVASPRARHKVLEAVALLLGALQSAQHDRDRHSAERPGRQPQIAWDDEAIERHFETDRRRREHRRVLTLE